MVLRDADGMVADSLNYGSLVDPWAAEGYQATSGPEESGCYVKAPGPAGGFNPFARMEPQGSDASSGRSPDGHDTDSNCGDFLTTPTTNLSAPAKAGATNIKTAAVAGFEPGETINIGAGAKRETAVIATVGTAGATTVETATSAGATVIPVANTMGFSNGQTINVGSGSNSETAVIVSTSRRRPASITIATPLKSAYAAGTEVSGTGITLTGALTKEHPGEAQVAGSAPTPGAPNHYYRKTQ